ncbi:GTPase domain-containing protein [Phanerochaete sordida]|uniref:GTPase domain-containing protein n=1 Tax=Phanerochaete sordida TaxID=48140 RepID=A0A9P3G9L9_9APHY|nr:GTPase domain-containing protein [Phanerochaete sordida]
MSKRSSAKGEPRAANKRVNEKEVLIAVMGATGTGKSTFINHLSGAKLQVSDGIESCTSDVQATPPFQMFGMTVKLIDTPGFDDTTQSDAEILERIATYLTETYKEDVKLNGIIYLYRISDMRLGGIARRNFGMFRKLCGDDALSNVAVVTTMWDTVEESMATRREEQLKTNAQLFAPVLAQGAKMYRHYGRVETAQAVLRPMTDMAPRAFLIQEEIVDEGKKLGETAAGTELDSKLEAALKQQVQQLQRAQEDMQRAFEERDTAMQKELASVRTDIQENITRIEGQRDRLASSNVLGDLQATLRRVENGISAEQTRPRDYGRPAGTFSDIGSAVGGFWDKVLRTERKG